VESALRWYESIDPPGTINALFAANALVIGGILILLEHLDRVACAILDRFRPVLALDHPEYQSLCYQLTTLPARPALLVSLLCALAIVLQVLTGNTRYMQAATLYMAPLSGAVDALMGILWAVVLGVLFYHTIWQLRLMHHLYSKHTRVHLFEVGSLYAFSRLTAHTAIALVLLAYVELLVLPDTWHTDPGVGGLTHYGIILAIIGIAAVTFAWPLLDAHRLLAEEKEQRLAALAQQMDAAISELQRPLETGQPGPVEVTRRKEALDTLVLAENRIHKISTWPWSTGTISSLATAILVPVLLWFIIRLLERVIP
jgi:hypothetical protein